MNTIAVIDFGGQYAHLIANRIRRLNVYSEIHPASVKPESLKYVKGIIFSGGPQSVYAEESLQCDPRILELPVPILGICYGHQLLCHLLGGTVQAGTVKEYGKATLHVTHDKSPLWKNIDTAEEVWMSHFDEIIRLPEGAQSIGTTEDCDYAAVDFGQQRYGIQFHCEVTHTPHGMTILDNFLNLCNVKREWSLDRFIEREIEAIAQQANGRNVFLLISGGVDSTVAFILLEKALGPENVYGLFVDHGLMRKDEGTHVVASLERLGVKNLHVYHGEKEFLEALEGVVDPEKKRLIIGNQFLKIQQKVANQLNLNSDEWLLGQGTIYPDTIESGGTQHADKIKTHHNRVPQIEALIAQGKIIEPIKELYKDEVRAVGEKLGLDQAMVWRHPFPGPGLGVRCLCLDKAYEVEEAETIERDIDAMLKNKGCELTAKILPIKSVGVQGDVRSYRHPVALSGQANWAELEAISPQITNRFLTLNRVLIHLGKEPVRTTHVIPSTLTKARLDLLREADAIVDQMIIEYDLNRIIWQFPVVLIPLSVNKRPGESIVLRPICSTDVMTANFTQLDWPIIKAMAEAILALDGISTVFYDITNKPPGTVEWE